MRGAHLVVREGEVGAAALDVEAHAEMVEGDGHALDVPAGTSTPERSAVPAGFALAGRHPEHRVEGVLLARPVRVAAALGGQQPHRLGVETRDLAEVRVGLDGEVDIPFEFVRRARVPQALDERDDPRYRLDGAYVLPRRQHPQGRHVLAEEDRLLLGERGPVDTVALCPLQERVVDVGDILDVVNLPLGVEPHALHEVERVVRRRVPYVGGVVRGDATDVDTGDGTGVEGDQTAGRGVVDPQVAALTRQGGDLGSGPGMHVMSVTGLKFHIRMGAVRTAEKAFLRELGVCAATRVARESPATPRSAPDASPRRAAHRHARVRRRSRRR